MTDRPLTPTEQALLVLRSLARYAWPEREEQVALARGCTHASAGQHQSCPVPTLIERALAARWGPGWRAQWDHTRHTLTLTTPWQETWTLALASLRTCARILHHTDAGAPIWPKDVLHAALVGLEIVGDEEEANACGNS